VNSTFRGATRAQSAGPRDLPRDDRPRRSWLVWHRLPWWLELATIGTAYLVYEATRAVSAPNKTAALVHGHDIVRFEAWLHIDPEAALNRLINHWDLVSDLAGYYYSTLHFVITPLVLVFLWVRRPQLYPRLRSALVVATAAALVVYVVWPVAPPRFTTPALTDTLVRDHIMGMSDPHGVAGLINQYAAMPSLHVGWAIWCAVAVTAAFRSRWRYLAWIYPTATTFVVLATANHYVLDAVAGAVLILVTMVLTRPPAGVPTLFGRRLSSHRAPFSRRGPFSGKTPFSGKSRWPAEELRLDSPAPADRSR
jgi:hypothetical protein